MVNDGVFLSCHIHITVNNDYQHNSAVFKKFDQNKSFAQLFDVSQKIYTYILKTFNSEFSYAEVLFTNQNSNPLEIKDKINIILVINYCIIYKT